MALDDVYQQLLASIRNGAIDLYTAATTQPALAPLAGVLGLYRITTPWTLSNVTLTQNVASVVLTGDGSFGVPGAAPINVSPVAALLTVTSPSNDRFDLRLAVTSPGWTFPTTFPTLPVTETKQDNGVTYMPSFFAAPPMPLDRPVWSANSELGASLRLSGDLPLTGVLAQFVPLLGNGPLRLDGTVGLPASPSVPPDLDLRAIAAGSQFSVSFLSTLALRDLGLELYSTPNVDPLLWGITSFSVLNLTATLYLGDPPVTAHLFTPPLASSSLWRLLVGFDPGELPLVGGLATIAGFFGVPVGDLPIPTGFDDFTGFYFSLIEIGITPPGSVGLPNLGYLAITLGSTKIWQPPIPFVTIRDVGTRWLFAFQDIDGTLTPVISGNIYGTIQIGGQTWRPALGPGPQPRFLTAGEDLVASSSSSSGNFFRIDVGALVPQWIFTGRLRSDDTIPIGDALLYYFGSPAPPGTPPGMAITALGLEAAPLEQSYSANATITMDWAVPLGANVTLHLTGLGFSINANAGVVSGGISAVLVLQGGAPPGWDDPVFQIMADYVPSATGASGWVFSGRLYPDTVLEIKSLVSNFLGVTPPQSLPTLALERLALRFATVAQTYAIAGTVVGRWTPTLFGSQLNISASAAADIAKTEQGGTPHGKLVGTFSINRLSLEVGIDVGVDKPTYQFKIQFGALWLSAVTSWHGTAPNQHQVVTVQMGGITLGGILEYLVNLAAPTIGFELEAPWNLLNRVDLSRFQLRVDPTENIVDFTYDVNVDLVVMRVDKIGVRYQRQNGDSSVNLILYGNFLGKDYGTDPLSWDVVNDPPPAVPGQGQSLVDLYYLGLGQHVTLRDIDQLQTVRETLDRLEADMGEVENPNLSPLEQPAGQLMRFAPESEWLIGLDIYLMETVRLGLIFNDPRLYGLSIELGGERAGSLAGLKFEILYKKITDDIGMFRIELRLPEAFRHLEFGEVSVTLGVLVIEIYTNGNFFIDLGFPYNRNFDRSFTVQVFPFIGRGGIYFGVLDGNTSRRVPRISNGTFAPVLELGIGLAVGVGKDITVGPLSGGIYVQVEVIFQGVLAWFNPASSDADSAMYYWVQGVAAIHGKLYGSVNFVVIKVSITLDAYAQVSVVFESYKPAVFRLDVGVSVEAEVDFFFFSVSFSFDINLDVSFTIGSESPTPWILQGGGGGTNLLPTARRRPERRRQVLLHQHLRSLLSLGDTPPYRLTWNPAVRVFPDSPEPLPLTMLPNFGVTDLPMSWDGVAPPNPNPQYRVAFLLFAANGITPGASRAETLLRDASRSPHAADTTQLPAAQLLEAFLRWSISAVAPGATSVTAGQLALLADQITWSETMDQGFTRDNLAAFFNTNLTLQIAGDPGGSPPSVGGMAFPIPPFLNWTSPQVQARDFFNYNSVGPLYEWGVAGYVDQFQPLAGPASTPPSDDPTQYQSFAAYAFRDYCLMLARSGVQSAVQALEGWPYSLAQPMSLTDIANDFPKATVQYAVRDGDTVESVAAALGATPDELLYLNPSLPDTLAAATAGQVIPILLGIAPEVVAGDNAGAPLAPATLALGDVDYQAQAGDTLAGIAQRFGVQGAAALFTGTLADDAQLLLPRATFTAFATTWTPPRTLTALQVAATLFVRYLAPEVPYDDWYAQTIFDFSQASLGNLTWNDPIPADTTLNVPPQLADPDPTHAIPYVTLPGDTLARVASSLSLAQNFAAGTGPDAAWPPFRAAVQPSGSGFTIPQTVVAVQLGESVNRLGDRTLIYSGNLAGLLGWIGGAPILSPLAVVTVPDLTATVVSGDSFASVATRFGLTVGDLASRVSSVKPIFAGSQIVIAHLPVQSVDALVQKVLAGDAPSQVSCMTSRQLLSGLTLPAPEDQGGHQAATGSLTAFYDLSGQQFPGPTPDPTQPSEVALSVTFQVDAAATGWITLMSSTTLGPGETAGPEARRYNRALDEARVFPGQVLVTGPTPQLAFQYTNAQLTASYPPSGLAVTPLDGPSPVDNAGRAPRTYGLDHRIELQASSPLPIPSTGSAPLAGNPGLWPFPNGLLARTGGATPFEIVRSSSADPRRKPETVANATFATLLPFTVRRMEQAEGVYSLLGADTANRQVLVQIWRYLNDPLTPPGTQAWLAVAPSPNAGNASGLGVLALDATRPTYLIKTNQSTVTRPGVRALATSQWYASFTELADWLLLLWEGSTVGGNGYWLGVSTVGGGHLPESAFDEHGNATLLLVLLAGEQQSVVPVGRPLLPFNNCAITAPGIDASATLFVEASDDSDLLVQPLLPPGNAGFTLAIQQPPAASSSAEAALQQMFSLLTFALSAASGSPFSASEVGPPIGPQWEDGNPLPRYQRERLRRWGRVDSSPGPSRWRYQQVVPVAKFGPPSVTPAVAGLPPPAGDPYRGLAGQSSLPSADFVLAFGDVLGNLTASPSSSSVSVPVGYTDALIGVTAWPAVTAWFSVTGVSSSSPAMLGVTIAPQPSVNAPLPGQSPVGALAALAKQADRYAQIYFQVAQLDVSSALLTTLSQNPDRTPVSLPVPIAPLRQFAAASAVLARSAANLLPLAPDLSQAPTLSKVSSVYGVSWADLAAANLDAPIVTLVGAVAVIMPAFAVFPDGSSADSLVASLHGGWPQPTGAQLLAANSALPLRIGAALTLPPLPVSISGSPALASLAATWNTLPGLLGADNAFTNVLADGFTFEMDGLQVVAGGSSGPLTLDAVRLAFAALGVNATVASIAAANADRPGLFADGAPVVTAHYVAKDGDTLAQNASHTAVQDLANNNHATINVFDAGALVLLGNFSPSPVISAGTTDTLGEFAARYGCPPAQLLAANPGLTLPAKTALLVPGGVAFPASGVYSPYQLRPGDTLTTVAASFAPAPGSDSPAANLAAANQAMPGTLTPGQSIVVVVLGQQYSTQTVPGDSFGSVLGRLGPPVTMADLVGVIGGDPRYLAVGALLICPPAKLAATTAPSGILALYGVTAGAFAEANTAVAGLLAEDVPLSYGTASVTTAQLDTLNAVIAGFAAQGVSVTASQLMDANPTAALFQSGALALLPPAPALLEVSLGVGAGPFAAPIFPLSTTLRLQRTAALVDPSFRNPDGSGDAERADSTVPAPARREGTPGEETFNAFAAAFEAALPSLRLATGKVASDPADLWVVDFTQGGVTSLTVAPCVTSPSGALWPRFFALRPLYNDLVSRTAVLPVVRDDGTLDESDPPTSLQGIDVEIWARRFLADVDRFLSVPYATGAFAVAATSLDAVLNAKQTLVQAIPPGLAPILSLTDSGLTAGLADAKRVLGQELAIELSRAYASAAIVQYAASVTSVWTQSQLPPARLVGQLTPVTADPTRSFSLSGAKTSLDQSSSLVSVLLSVTDPSLRAGVPIDLDYLFTDVEFNIASVPGVSGYQASDWLSLLPPISKDNHPPDVNALLGAATVPIPLRAYPALPALLGQTAAATFKGPGKPTLLDAKQWTFGLTYSHEHAAQDEVLVTARFNVAPPQKGLELTVDTDVAAQLARYAAAADKLWALLAGYAAPAGDPTILANASASFALLAGQVATAWNGRWPAPPESDDSDTAATQSFGFSARLTYGVIPGGTPYLDTLRLTSLKTAPGPTGAWPTAYARLPGGERVQLTPGTPVGTLLVYQFPASPQLSAGPWPEITLEWPGLDVTVLQNARASVSVRRNQQLLDGIDTTDGFVYKTALVEAPDVVTPLNSWSDAFTLSGATPTAALQAALTALFGSTLGAPLTIGMFYGYQLAAGAEPLITYLPVGLYPNQTLSATTASDVGTALQNWWSGHQPASASGSWVLSLTLYSQVDVTGKRALLSLERLIYPLTSGAS